MHKDIPLALYKKIHASMPIPCVDAVIMYKGETLLCKRANKPAQGLWWFAGGRVKRGETIQEAIVRKVKQETGLDIKIISQLGTEDTIFPDGPFGGDTHTINTIFLAEPKGRVELTYDDQHDEFEWFKTVKRDFHPYIKKYIKLAQQTYEKGR
jgi:colanic acid biosynthesis protein WcaH